jgi:hypothetical protein
VYYASSRSSEGFQAADLIAGIRRRWVEGDQGLAAIDARLSVALKSNAVGPIITDRRFQNWHTLF